MDVRFTTRIVVHDADEEDYETLHEAMEAEGFTKTKTDSNTRIEYHLTEALSVNSRVK